MHMQRWLCQKQTVKGITGLSNNINICEPLIADNYKILNSTDIS